MADKKKSTQVNKNKKEKITSASKLDVVEVAKKEFEKLEQQSVSKDVQSHLPWSYMIGAVAITLGVIIFGYIFNDMMKVKKLETALEEIIKPLSGGMPIETIGKPKKVSGIYQFTIKFEGIDQEFTSYITSDQKYFFVDAIEVDELLQNNTEQEKMEAGVNCETVDKSEKPVLSVYVSSDCGYCKQAEIALASAIKAVPVLANQIKLHYPGSVNEEGQVVSFLGGIEAGEENLRQICLRDEQGDAFWPYINCMATEGDSKICLKNAEADQTKLKTCMEDKDKGQASILADGAQANLLQLTGTPGVYINDTQKVDDMSFGGRTADAFKKILCCASNEQPDFCNQTLE